MKKKLMQISTIILIIAMSGCKKDVLQPNWWDRLWHKETPVMCGLNTPLSQKAWKVWQASYEQTFMPAGDGSFSMSGDFVSIMQDYLDLRREYDRKKALKKLWLCVPKDLYEQDSHFWEWWLSKVGDYLTVTLGGPDAWTDGTRILSQEMEIYPFYLALLHRADTRLLSSFGLSSYSPTDLVDPVLWGDDWLPNGFEAQIQLVRHNNAKKLHDRFLNVSDQSFEIGPVSDYETKLVNIGGAEYYALAIPNVPTRE